MTISSKMRDFRSRNHEGKKVWRVVRKGTLPWTTRLWRVVQGIVARCPGYCGGLSLWRVVFVASCLEFVKYILLLSFFTGLMTSL